MTRYLVALVPFFIACGSADGATSLELDPPDAPLAGGGGVQEGTGGAAAGGSPSSQAGGQGSGGEGQGGAPAGSGGAAAGGLPGGQGGAPSPAGGAAPVETGGAGGLPTATGGTPSSGGANPYEPPFPPYQRRPYPGAGATTLTPQEWERQELKAGVLYSAPWCREEAPMQCASFPGVFQLRCDDGAPLPLECWDADGGGNAGCCDPYR